MTAIVGVLNKRAVAIAADSAVTMGNTHKVINSANKIFTLSKFYPVAVMTYNNAAFMGTPWEIIIKEYRKQLGNKSFPLLKNYVDDFLLFLHNRNFFCDDQTQYDYIKYILDYFYNLCCEEIKKANNLPKDSTLTVDQIQEKLNSCLANNKNAEKCPEFESLSLEEFKQNIGNHIELYAKNKGFPNHQLLAEAFYYYFIAEFSQPFYTGLVFTGYGEDEIFPSLIPLNIVCGIENRLKYFTDKNNSAIISEHGTEAAIIPFAQVDVTQTIIRGINPSFQDIIYNVIDKSFKSLCGAITKILDSNPNSVVISNAVKTLNIDSVINETTLQINKEMRATYTSPLLNTVISLDKEDMANMADSFISLTSLVRRMQPGEETVGGPVDVAVISKGDGFVWIKRKHYFSPELNPTFFNKYFK